MKRAILLLAMIGVFAGGYSQTAIPPNMRAQITLGQLSNPVRGLSGGDMLYGIPMEPGTVIGDNYLDKKWNKASILLYQSETMIEGYPVKYDVKSDLLEIKSATGIKVIEGKKIKNMVWIDSLTTKPHYFVNGGEYRFEGVKSMGLLEVLVDGATPLMIRAEVNQKKANYNPALDVGSKDMKIYIKEIFLYANNGELIKIKNKESILKAAGSRAEEVESFIKVNKLNTNKQPGLTRVFEFINSND